MDNEVLYAKLVDAIGIDTFTVSGKIQTTTVCPWCGSASSKGHIRNSFGKIFDSGRAFGFKCFVCHEAHALISLALAVGLGGTEDYERQDYSALVSSARTVQQDPFWTPYVEDLQEVYTAHPERHRLWWDYKRVPPDVVDKWGLGVGVAPWRESQIHDALNSRGDVSLITPMRRYDGSVMGFRARRPDGGWLSFTGLTIGILPLQHLQVAASNKIVMVLENYVDALLVNEFGGDGVGAVATLSTSYMSDEWLAALRYVRPRMTVVAYDADIPGNGPVSQEHLLEYAHSRRPQIERLCNCDVEISGVQPTQKGFSVLYSANGEQGSFSIPAPAGVRLSNMLLANGIPSMLVKWNQDQAYMDVGKLWLEEFEDDDYN